MQQGKPAPGNAPRVPGGASLANASVAATRDLIRVRDAALTRLSRLTRAAAALALAATGFLAAFAASSFHGRSPAVATSGAARLFTSSSTLPSPAATVPVAGTANASGAVPPVASAPSAAPSAPTPSASPPVAVSGGS